MEAWTQTKMEDVVDRLILEKEQEWIRNNIAKLDRLTDLQRNVIRLIYQYEKIQCLHVRGISQRLGCSAMAVTKVLKKLKKLGITKTVNQQEAKNYLKKYVRLNWEYESWVRVVLNKINS